MGRGLRGVRGSAQAFDNRCCRRARECTHTHIASTGVCVCVCSRTLHAPRAFLQNFPQCDAHEQPRARARQTVISQTLRINCDIVFCFIFVVPLTIVACGRRTCARPAAKPAHQKQTRTGGSMMVATESCVGYCVLGAGDARVYSSSERSTSARDHRLVCVNRWNYELMPASEIVQLSC